MAAPIAKVSLCHFCGIPRIFLARSVSKQQRRYRSTNLKEDANPDWQPVIGLEVHAQIKADGKLFSGASSKYGAPVNTQVAFLDSALPGTLPVLNRRCVEAGVLTALALQCKVNKVSRFDRKHYFYADLPAGYQITQQTHALANNGVFRYLQYGKHEADCLVKWARILQVQLEQDSGKSLHDDIEGRSLIDLNRAGCALMEIVTAPDFTSGDEARSFVRDLKTLLVTLGTSDGNFSEGSIRVDANISVHRPDEPLGTRSEVKNINSINSLNKAIDFEVHRQIKLLERGKEVINETRSFDKDTGTTLPMRDKETKLDYRFMPEPNLPPLHLHSSNENKDTGNRSMVYVDILEEQLPKLPSEIREEVMERYGINLYRANIIVNEEIKDVYSEMIQNRDVEKFTTFLIHEFLGPLQGRDLSVAESGIAPSCAGKLYDWYKAQDLSLNSIRKIMYILIKDPTREPSNIANEMNLWQINDEEYLTSVCMKIIEQNPSQVAKVKRGKPRAINKLMGQARKMTDDRGNLVKIDRLFKELIMK